MKAEGRRQKAEGKDSIVGSEREGGKNLSKLKDYAASVGFKTSALCLLPSALHCQLFIVKAERLL